MQAFLSLLKEAGLGISDDSAHKLQKANQTKGSFRLSKQGDFCGAVS